MQHTPHKLFPHQRFWAWYRRRSAPTQINLLLILGFVLSLCFCYSINPAFAANNDGLSTVTPIPANQAVAISTATPLTIQPIDTGYGYAGTYPHHFFHLRQRLFRVFHLHLAQHQHRHQQPVQPTPTPTP